MKIRRQHHVWQHYLRAWATAQNRIYCGQDGRVFPVNAAKVAVQTDFYRLDPLTAADVAFIRNMAIKTAHQRARAMHEQLLGILTAIGRLHASGAGNGDAELRTLLDDSVNNTVEQYHSSIETRSQPLLDAARRGDVSFYADDESAISFIQYLGMQYFRTVGIRERMIEQVRDPYGADIARCWTILSLIYGSTIGGSLYVEGLIAAGVPFEGVKGLAKLFEVIAIAPQRKLAVACMHCRFLCPDEGRFLQLVALLQRRQTADAKEVLLNWVAPAAARLALPHAKALADGLASQGYLLPNRPAMEEIFPDSARYPVPAYLH